MDSLESYFKSEVARNRQYLQSMFDSIDSYASKPINDSMNLLQDMYLNNKGDFFVMVLILLEKGMQKM